jgi:hypothetical protein
VTEIFLPGLGRVPFNITTAKNAVSEYDPDMLLGRNEATGDWQALLKDGPHGEPFPVFTFGPRLPSAEEIQRSLYMADVRKRGHEIVRDIARRQEEGARESQRKHEDYAGEVAERMEFEFIKSGERSRPRIYVPSGKE